jgi:phage terminase small subunit
MTTKIVCEKQGGLDKVGYNINIGTKYKNSGNGYRESGSRFLFLKNYGGIKFMETKTGSLYDRDYRAQLEKQREEVIKSNSFLKSPGDLSDEERLVWDEIATLIISSTHYKKTAADVELLRQYCQTKIMRDRAWVAYNKNPERYIRIVTGVCGDGKTPKVLVKENEHYKTLIDCNKQLEKLLKDFRLTPDARKR